MKLIEYMQKHRPDDLKSNIKNTFYPELDVEYFSIVTLHRYLGHCDPSVLPDDLRARVDEFSLIFAGAYKNTFAPAVNEEYLTVKEIIRFVKKGKLKWQDVPKEFIDDLKNEGPKWIRVEDEHKQYVKTELQKIGRWQEQKVQINA